MEVILYSGQRNYLPTTGYRPNAIFNETKEYWEITIVCNYGRAKENTEAAAPVLDNL